MANATAVDILHQIARALEPIAPVSIGTMFRSPGLRHGDSIVVFLGHDDRLVVKLPRERAVELLEAGEAQPVTMGTRTMREWVAIPSDDDPVVTLERWRPMAAEALAYVRRLDDEKH